MDGLEACLRGQVPRVPADRMALSAKNPNARPLLFREMVKFRIRFTRFTAMEKQ